MTSSIADMSAEPNANPNADTIAGLREAIDFLEQHPELPVSFASVHIDVPYGPEARQRLEQTARALGATATERVSSGDVVIESDFAGKAHIYARARIEHLGAEVQPRYRPILPVES